MTVVQLRVLTIVKKPQMQMAKGLSNVRTFFRLILCFGTPNIPLKSYASEAPSEDPPDTANSICYCVPSPPASPFIPDSGPIPEGKGLMTLQHIMIPSCSNDLSRLPSPEAREVKSPNFSTQEYNQKKQQTQASNWEYLRRLLDKPEIIGLPLALVEWLEENSHRSTDVNSSSSPASPQPPFTSIDPPFKGLECLQNWLKDNGFETVKLKLKKWLKDNSNRSTSDASSSSGEAPPPPTDVRYSDLEYYQRLLGALPELLKWLEKNSYRLIHYPSSSSAKTQRTTNPPCPPTGTQVPDLEFLRSLIVVLLVVVLLVATVFQLERRLGNNSSQSTCGSTSTLTSRIRTAWEMSKNKSHQSTRGSSPSPANSRPPLVDALLKLVSWLENNRDGRRSARGSSSSRPCIPIDGQISDLGGNWDPLVDALLKLVQCLEKSPSTSPKKSPTTSPQKSPSTSPKRSPTTSPKRSPTTSPEPPMAPLWNLIDQQLPGSEYPWIQPLDTLLELMRNLESNKP